MSTKKPTGKQKGSVQKRVDWKALEIVHPDAAGIDVGGSEHWVAVSPDGDPEPVRRFGCFTEDLREMGQWLVQRGVRSVAMQSTGVYWMPVFEVLEQHGLEVYLVNARLDAVSLVWSDHEIGDITAVCFAVRQLTPSATIGTQGDPETLWRARTPPGCGAKWRVGHSVPAQDDPTSM